VLSDCWNACAGALEGCHKGPGHAHIGHRALHRVGGLSERHVLGKVEADRHRRKLPLMGDGKRPHRDVGPAAEHGKRHLFPRQRRFKIDLVERVDFALHLGRDLQDHVIGVHLREILRDLALSERVIERVVDQLRLDAEALIGVAIDCKLERRAFGLLVGGGVA
jgi:hypothetical protein